MGKRIERGGKEVMIDMVEQTKDMSSSEKRTSAKESLRQTVYFLLICLGASFLIDLITYLSIGPLHESDRTWGVILRFRMLVPALTASILLMIMNPHKVSVKGKIFFSAFFGIVFVPLIFIALGYRSSGIVLQRVLTILLTGYVIVLHMKPSWKSDIVPLGLRFDRNPSLFLLILVLLIVLMAVSFSLNPVFGFSEISPDGSLRDLFISVPRLLILIPLFGWVSYFGEEYGWRYYLQERLCSLLGPRRGVIILGVIWGIWHAPIIAMGHNYPGRPYLGMIVMGIFTVIMGIYFSYTVMRTGSIWSAVILHGIMNTLSPLFMSYFGQAGDSVFSFGLGLYGIVLFGLPAAFLFLGLKGAYRNERESIAGK